MSIVQAGAHFALFHRFTTECINAMTPGIHRIPENVLLCFVCLTEAAEHIVRHEPPPAPNSYAILRHVIDWTGEQ